MNTNNITTLPQELSNDAKAQVCQNIGAIQTVTFYNAISLYGGDIANKIDNGNIITLLNIIEGETEYEKTIIAYTLAKDDKTSNTTRTIEFDGTMLDGGIPYILFQQNGANSWETSTGTKQLGTNIQIFEFDSPSNPPSVADVTAAYNAGKQCFFKTVVGGKTEILPLISFKAGVLIEFGILHYLPSIAVPNIANFAGPEYIAYVSRDGARFLRTQNWLVTGSMICPMWNYQGKYSGGTYVQYTAGDYVLYDGFMYKAITTVPDHATPANTLYWKNTNIIDIIQSLHT